jgi:integrase
MKLERVDKAPEYLRKDPVSGYFWFDIYRHNLNPKRLCRSTGEKVSKARAVEIAERAIAKWMGTTFSGKTRTASYKEIANEFMDQYRSKLTTKKIRVGTLRNAEIYVPENVKSFGHLIFNPDDEDDWTKFLSAWKRFVAERQKNHPGMTIINFWKHHSLVMTHAFHTGMLKRPWDVENPDPKKKVGRVLTEAEKAAIMSVALPNLRDQLLFAMTMGMRLREHLYLTWDRVDFENRTIILREENVKTGKARTIKMSPQVHEMLLRRKEGYHSHGRGVSEIYVFPARGDLSKPAHQNKSAWNTAKANAHIEGRCRYHDLRHTFLTECAKLVREGRVSVVLVCAYAGLSIKTFENVYLHLNHHDTAAVSELVAVRLPLIAVKLRENEKPNV